MDDFTPPSLSTDDGDGIPGDGIAESDDLLADLPPPGEEY